MLESGFRALVEGALDAYVVIDASGRVMFWNRAAENLFGYSDVEMIGQSLERVMPERFRDRHLLGISRLAAGSESRVAGRIVELAGLRRDGSEVPIEMAISICAGDDGPAFAAVIRDITERKRAETALAQSRDFYLTLFEEFPAYIWRAGTDGKCDYFNHSWLEFTGRTLEQEVGDGWVDGVHPDDLARCLRIYTASFGARHSFDMEYRLRRHDDQYRWIADFGRPYYDPFGEFAGYIGSCYDVTERKHYERRLADAAKHDPLTGLLNRRAFDDALADAEVRASAGAASALLFLDLDGFKEVNDSFGHEAGDKALTDLAESVQANLRDVDSFARFGGDEFAVLLDGVTLDVAETVAERIRLTIAEIRVGDAPDSPRLGASIGVAPLDAEHPASVALRQADVAMYRAKLAGRGRVSLAGHAAE